MGIRARRLGDTMNRISKICLVAASVLIAYSGVAFSQEGGKQPLRLVQTIPLPNVKGRLDHIDVDVKGNRLFVAGLENGTFEVVDLKAGKWLQSIPGFKKAQGALFVPELNKLFLASGDDGMVRVFRGDTLELLDSIHLEPGPNRVVYEPKSKLIYVGYGGKDAGKDYGEVGIIDARQDKHVGDIKVVAHPSEILLDKSGSTLFVFSSVANRLLVIDASKRDLTRPHLGYLLEPAHLPRWLSWTRNRARKWLTSQRLRGWTASTLMQGASEYTSRVDGACRLVLPLSINRRMLTTTRLLARFPQRAEPVHPSGRLSSIATTSLHQRVTMGKQRFWCMRHRIERTWRA